MNKEDMKKWTKLIVIASLAYLIVSNIEAVGSVISLVISIISPFIVGGCIAFILNLPMSYFEKIFSKYKTKKGKKLNKNFVRAISLVLAIIVIVFIISLIIRLIVPEMINVVKLLIDNWPTYSVRLQEIFVTVTEDFPEAENVIKNIDINNKDLQDQLKGVATNFLSTSVSVVGSVVSSIFNFVVSIVFAMYILTSKEKLKEQAKKILHAYCTKEKAEKIIELGRLARTIFGRFITGQCTEATILGTLSIIGMLILKIPYAVPIGVLIGVTALIPIVGAFIGIIIGAILILSVAPAKVLTFIIFILILQQLEGNLIYPKVVGDSVGLPGIWVLVAVAVGGDLFGVVGMLLGVPTASILYKLLKNDVNKKVKSK